MLKEFVYLQEYKLKEEIVWEYSCQLLFNQKEINWITITDHTWKKKGREMITKELIHQLISKLNRKKLWPTKYSGIRKVFRFNTSCQDGKYRLIFWFKDHTTNHLWIRNCYPIN